jgi:gamma-tubulin complex component 5
MDADQSWTDFHFLNAAFSDTVQVLSNGQDWIDPTLVRLSYRRNRLQGHNVSRTVTAIDGLTLEYAIPFPLTFLFGPRSLRVYGTVFVFLLQIQRVKTLLERISLKAFATLQNVGNALKALWAMRSKLYWFIKRVLLMFPSRLALMSEL